MMKRLVVTLKGLFIAFTLLTTTAVWASTLQQDLSDSTKTLARTETITSQKMRDANPRSGSTKSSGKSITRPITDRSEALSAQMTARFHASPVWVHSTWLSYITDLDGDGFYHHFRFGFDADTDYHNQALYAALFLVQDGDEILLYESEDFHIHGQSGEDAYEITTSLNSDYPTQTYHLILRLYDADSFTLVSELTYLDDPTLANIYLEDSERDTEFQSTPYLYAFSTELLQDNDADGFYTQLNLFVDVDAPFHTSTVIIGVELYDPQQGWIQVLMSEAWLIEGSQDTDARTVRVELENGLPEQNYEVRLTLYEAFSRAIIATETISQRYPLESRDYDRNHRHQYGSSTSTGATIEGGSITLLLGILTLLLYSRRNTTSLN
jgi:hypothetical protein